MQDWDYHKKQFIKLGGLIDNLTCREGSNGRGMFREGKDYTPKILCPEHLLLKAEDVSLIADKFRLKESSGHSPEAKEFIENYYQYFSWEESERKEIAKFTEEIFQMPQQAKNLLLSGSLCTNNILNREPSPQHTFQRFIRSRAVNYKGKSVLAPIWELVNHSPSERPFKTSKNGIETPAYPTNSTTHEIFHPYKMNASPLHIFFNYGFVSDELFAYSLPVKIQLIDRSLAIEIKGVQRGIKTTKKNMPSSKNTIAIPALPLGSVSRELPKTFFYSIIQEHGMKESKAASLFRELQLANLNQRKRLKDHLSINHSDTAKNLIKSIEREINLIEGSLQIP